MEHRKILQTEEFPEFALSIEGMSQSSKSFVDMSLAIVETIHVILKRKNITQRDLAERIGITEARVSQLLSPMRNLTLRSIADIEAALGEPIIKTTHHATT